MRKSLVTTSSSCSNEIYNYFIRKSFIAIETLTNVWYAVFNRRCVMKSISLDSSKKMSLGFFCVKKEE